MSHLADGTSFAGDDPHFALRPRLGAESDIARSDGTVEMLPSKVPHMQIRAGERFVCIGPAGGGYGDPLARDPGQVRADVADRVLAAEAARDQYGVALTSVGTLDEAETARLRTEITSPHAAPTQSE
jgi:N-methylhydantoinase B/oxoprolinase/acetone carboxylase alpha subunit